MENLVETDEAGDYVTITPADMSIMVRLTQEAASKYPEDIEVKVLHEKLLDIVEMTI